MPVGRGGKIMKKLIWIVAVVLLFAMVLPGCAQTKAEEEQVVGGYTADRALAAEDRAIFDEAMAGLMGVSYEPTLVATQVVAGTNYRFTATATVVVPDAEPSLVHIFIFKPLGDNPAELVEIVDA